MFFFFALCFSVFLYLFIVISCLLPILCRPTSCTILILIIIIIIIMWGVGFYKEKDGHSVSVHLLQRIYCGKFTSKSIL